MVSRLDDLFVEPATRGFLKAYLNKPSHALLLEGKKGSGLGTLAVALAETLTIHATDYVVVAPDDKSIISIETVRSLYTETRGAVKSNQVIVIDDIDAMSTDAEHAFLKLLEEPPKNTLFVATTSDSERLLATIHSRFQRINVQSISAADSKTLAEQSGANDATKLRQILFLAEGRPAEIVRLATDQEYFEQASKTIRDARSFLTASTYDRLVLAQRYSDRASALYFVRMLAGVVKFSVEKNYSSTYGTVAEAIETCFKRLTHNGHVKTQLLHLALALP